MTDEVHQEHKARVFISYSRSDMAFADRLEAALKTGGSETMLDRTNIYAFEDWWQRIQVLIEQADTIVFVLSPEAVASKICLKEVEFAASLNKRFAPIVWRPVSAKTVPEALEKLNFIFFDDDTRFEESVNKLNEALHTDIAWIRQHTEFGEAARRWIATSEPSGLLLRSPVLEHAERWIAGRPADAPAPTEETQRFIRRSRQAATRRRNMLTGSLAAGLVLALGLAGLAYWQRGIAVEQRAIAVQAEKTATEQKEIAQQQRDRAERTLHTATDTANTLVADLAKEFRDRPGMPLALTRSILDRARNMQRQLTESGETSPELRRNEAVALSDLSVTLQSQGDLGAALAAAERARELVEQAAAANPNKVLWQQNLSVSYGRLGEVLRASGKAAEALAAYRKAAEISERLAGAANEMDLGAHADLALDLEHVGDVLADSGNREEALAAYRRALAVFERFGDTDGGSQWRLATIHTSIGGLLRVTGREEEALQSLRAAVELMTKAVVSLPDNLRAQGDLANAYQRLGSTLRDLRRSDETTEVLLAGVRIRRQIAASDPTDAQRQTSLATSYENYYQALVAAGRSEEGKEILRQLVAIREQAAKANPRNLTWQYYLASAYSHLAISLADKSNPEPALGHWRKSLAILEKITALNPEQIDWQTDMAAVLGRIGDTLADAGRFDEALTINQRALQIEEKAVATNPANALWQANLGIGKQSEAWVHFALGHLEDSLQYLDEAIAIKSSLRLNRNPKDEASTHWARALARMYAGRLEEAAADLDNASKLHPDEMYYPLWLHIVRARLGIADETEFAAQVKDYDRSKWPGPLIDLYLGRLDEESVRTAVLAAEKESDRAAHVCETDLFGGIYQLAKGSHTEGRRLLQSAVDHCPSSDGVIVRWELKRLDGGLRQDDKTTAIANCDRLAASNLDPERPASIPGVSPAELKPNLAVPACEAALKLVPDNRRIMFQLARAYSATQNYENARALYEQADALGHPLATNNLGALYADGYGVETNLAEARRLYEKAARAGFPLAMSNLAFFLERGQGGAKDYEQARYWYEKAAAGGIAYAAYRVGLMYHNGYGVPEDIVTARHWYEKAAAGGHGQSMMEIGFMYERGRAVPVDYAKAREWYEKGAAAGNAPSMGNLGALYSRGWGVPQDYTNARQWYERAAAAGNYIAMYNLGLIYGNGTEVPVDYAAARSWFEKSAAQGYPPAMSNLGWLYENGRGVERDLAEAARWYEKAAAKGDEQAKKNLARLQELGSKKE